MKRVYICSPLHGNIKQNISNAVCYGKFAIKERGMVPIIPHFFALMLDDNTAEEREIGLNAGRNLLLLCNELYVFGNERSEGMKNEIKLAQALRIPITEFADKKTNKILNKYGGNIYDETNESTYAV